MDKKVTDFAKIWKKQSKKSAKSKPELIKLQKPDICEMTGYNPDEEEDVFLKDMPAYCDQLDLVIIHAKKILSKAYEKQNSKKLLEQLSRNVAELMCIQKEIKTITENLAAMKNQVTAVQKNLNEQKNKLKSVRNEERRTRFLLNAELKHTRAARFAPDMLPIPRLTIGSATAVVSSRASTNSLTLPNLNIPEPFSPENRIFKMGNRNFIGPLNKPKIIRPQPKLKINKLATDDQQNESVSSSFGGVTVYLHPISETERPENPRSQQSTPNTSVANIPWLSNLSASETTTFADSAISETNSLSVVNSVETVEDVD